MKLYASQHVADCGGADSYGSALHLRFPWIPGQGCSIDEGIVLVQDTGFHDNQRQIDTFRVEGGKVDLADPQLRAVILRSSQGDRAIQLFPDEKAFYYYDEVKPGGELRIGLPTGDEPLPQPSDATSEENSDAPTADAECCWGATQNWYTFGEIESNEAQRGRSAVELLGPEPWDIVIERFEGDRSEPSCKAFFPTRAELETFFRKARPSGFIEKMLYPKAKCAAHGQVASARGSLPFTVTEVGTGAIGLLALRTGLACDEACFEIFAPWGTSFLTQWQHRQHSGGEGEDSRFVFHPDGKETKQ